jgi:hypothetical protein
MDNDLIPLTNAIRDRLIGLERLLGVQKPNLVMVAEITNKIQEFLVLIENRDAGIPRTPAVNMTVTMVEGRAVPAIQFDNALWVRR